MLLLSKDRLQSTVLTHISPINDYRDLKLLRTASWLSLLVRLAVQRATAFSSILNLNSLMQACCWL